MWKDNALLKKIIEDMRYTNPFVNPEKYSKDMLSVNDKLFKFASWGLACVALKYTAVLLHSRLLAAIYLIYDINFCSLIAATISANLIHPIYFAYSKRRNFEFIIFAILTVLLLVVTRFEIDKLITAAAFAKCQK